MLSQFQYWNRYHQYTRGSQLKKFLPQLCLCLNRQREANSHLYISLLYLFTFKYLENFTPLFAHFSIHIIPLLNSIGHIFFTCAISSNSSYSSICILLFLLLSSQNQSLHWASLLELKYLVRTGTNFKSLWFKASVITNTYFESFSSMLISRIA